MFCECRLTCALKKVLFIVHSVRTVMYNPFHAGLVRYILVFRTLTTSSCKVYNFTTRGLEYTLYVLCIKGKGKVIPLQARCDPEGG